MMARVVYSTGPRGASSRAEHRCERCKADPCRCEPAVSLPPGSQSVHVRLERAGRRGKAVTVASPLVLTREDALLLLADFKRRFGSGGTLKRDPSPAGEPCFVLEIQGDHVDPMLVSLTALGYKVRPPSGRK